jgi:outer membrane protein assembly factor BamB
MTMQFRTFGIRALCLFVIWCLGLGASSRAADFPQFRGPTGDGHAQAHSLPSTWNESTNVAWKTPIPGKGWSSASLFQSRLYLTTAVPVDPASERGELSLRSLCVDAKSGQVVWDREVFVQPHDAPKIHSKNSHASPTPLVTADRVYVHFGHQGTACLDHGGQVVWKNNSLSYAPVHGNGGSPILVRGRLIFTADGASDPAVIALDAATGELAWRFERPGDPVKKFAFCTPTAIVVGGRTQVVCPGSGVVNALDPDTGQEIWRVEYDGYSVIPKPLFGYGLVFLSTGYDSPEVLAIRADGRGDVTATHVAWRLKKGAPHTPSMLLVGDELYMVSDRGVATCVDARTGREHWQERVGGNYSASLVYADDKIYLQSEEGPALVIRPGKRFQRIADAGFPERTLASYAVGDNALFVRTEKNLYRVEGR